MSPSPWRLAWAALSISGLGLGAAVPLGARAPEREVRAQLAHERRLWAAERSSLRRENRRLRAVIAAGGTTAPNAHLRVIAACESGGNPRAVSPGGQYRGKYQFDRRTWRSVGGSGDPAAAPEIEQDWRAWILYQRRGAQPWPVCGRR
jgi:soluble lytic murein transglycosylase-like protein